MKKKILLITHNFWPENFPINDIARILGTKYFDLIVLTGKPNYPLGKIYNSYNPYSVEQEFFYNNINIIRVPIVPRGSGSFLFLFFNYISFILSSILFGYFILKKKKIDLIFVYAPSPVIHCLVGIFFKFLKKKPLIIWLQDIWPYAISSSGYIKNKIIINILNIIIKFIYRSSDKILVQSKSFLRILKKNYKCKNLIYLPNHSSSLSFSKKKKYKTNYKLNQKDFNIIYAGNIGTVQDFDVIFKVAKKLTNLPIKFYFFGEGKIKKTLQKIIISEKIRNICINDYIDKRNLIEIIKKSSALIVTMKNDQYLNLIIPSKVQFYLSCKKPIIAVCSGETRKVIMDSSSGLVSNSGDYKKLYKNILYMYSIKDSIKFKKYKLNGYHYFKKNFTINKIIARIRYIISQEIK